jgi:hypothetical protein
MKIHLNDFQRSYAQNRIGFRDNLLSQELGESLRRTALACAENQKKEAGVIDIICGLYLQDPDEMKRHFRGDFESFVGRNFPIHRFGHEGLIPKVMLDQLASESGEAEAVGYSRNFRDDAFHLLWLSERLANSVGKRASLKDVIAAIALDREAMDELSRNGLTPARTLADFDQDIRTIIFHATPHMGEGWPRELDFEIEKEFRPPFMLEASTPSGPFQPVRYGRVKLNGSEVADVSWPEKPTATAEVILQTKNKVEIELDGPMFGSVELIVRGIPA